MIVAHIYIVLLSVLNRHDEILLRVQAVRSLDHLAGVGEGGAVLAANEDISGPLEGFDRVDLALLLGAYRVLQTLCLAIVCQKIPVQLVEEDCVDGRGIGGDVDSSVLNHVDNDIQVAAGAPTVVIAVEHHRQAVVKDVSGGPVLDNTKVLICKQPQS